LCGKHAGAYARTATQALTNVTYRYVETLADYGLIEACRHQPALVSGINVMNGKVTTRRWPGRTDSHLSILNSLASS